MSLDGGVIVWLKAGVLFFSSADPAIAARWGEAAIETEIVSPLALDGGAAAEGARQIAFLAGPLAIELHDVPGSGVEMLGTVRTISADALGYAAGLDVFVIGYEDREGSRTTLTVLRRL